MLSLVIIIATHLRQQQTQTFLIMKFAWRLWARSELEWGGAGRRGETSQSQGGKAGLQSAHPSLGKSLDKETGRGKKCCSQLFRVVAYHFNICIAPLLSSPPLLEGRQLKINSQEGFYHQSTKPAAKYCQQWWKLRDILMKPRHLFFLFKQVLFCSVHWILTQSKSIFKPELPAELWWTRQPDDERFHLSTYPISLKYFHSIILVRLAGSSKNNFQQRSNHHWFITQSSLRGTLHRFMLNSSISFK